MVTGSLWVPGETDINNVASFSFFGDSYICNRFRNIHLTHYSLNMGNLNQILMHAWHWHILLAQQVWKTSICWISLQWIGLAAIFLTLDVANTVDVTFLEIQERSLSYIGNIRLSWDEWSVPFNCLMSAACSRGCALAVRLSSSVCQFCSKLR